VRGTPVAVGEVKLDGFPLLVAEHFGEIIGEDMEG
jgi:hypothetical protein